MLDRQSSAMYDKRVRGRGKDVVLLTCFPRSVGLLAGICWKKSQSPSYSLGLGAMVTNDWCVKA